MVIVRTLYGNRIFRARSYDTLANRLFRERLTQQSFRVGRFSIHSLGLDWIVFPLYETPFEMNTTEERWVRDRMRLCNQALELVQRFKPFEWDQELHDQAIAELQHHVSRASVARARGDRG